MNGNRLKLARTAAGLSLRDLADRIDGLVTAQAIGKYEHNQMMPGSRVLIALARALGVSEDYLLSAGEIELQCVEFRKHVTSERDEAGLEAAVLSAVERYLEVEELLADVHTDWAPGAGFPYVVQTMDDAEQAARRLRGNWELGTDPIPSLSEFLEERGLKVIVLPLPAKVSGLKCWVRRRGGADVPVIVVNDDHEGERQRFTLAHELGHFMLDVADGINPEPACNRFASAFLMPADSFTAKVGRHRSALPIPELFELKRLFGASAQAIVYRCKDLQIISVASAASTFKLFSIRGWRKAEPMPGPSEAPKRFERLCFRALAEGIISEAKAAELLRISVRTLDARLDQVPAAA